MPERPLQILVGADVDANPDAGASGTVYQMNAALKRLGNEVDEIWQPELGRHIRHGNSHYALELPIAYRRAVRRRLAVKSYDVVELNQPHAYLAAIDHQRRGRPGVFVNRSHGHEVRSEEALEPWRPRLGGARQSRVRRMLSNGLGRLLKRQWDLISRTADGFIVSCSEDAAFLRERYQVAAERIGLVTQGVPASLISIPPAPFGVDRLQRLLYIGQFAFFKAPMVVAQVAGAVLAERPDAQMTWVCAREHHEQARAAVPEAIRARVTFRDWMPQSELLPILDSHGIFVFPSFFEGFGKAPLEAMARGLCVVASRTGGMRDYINDGTTGLLAPVGDAGTMSRLVLTLMGDTESAARISSAARARAAEHTWDRCARDAVTFYESLLDKKKA